MACRLADYGASVRAACEQLGHIQARLRMSNVEQPVSHIDLYHKLGKLEGIMESMMASVSSFQTSIKDVHARIDAIEDRQAILEKRQSQDKGANNALATLAKDFAIPVLAIAITWLISRGEINQIRSNPNFQSHEQQGTLKSIR